MIEKLTGNLTPNRFIHVDTEEHTVLEQLGKMQPKINEVVSETNRIAEDVKKKVYTDDLHNKYKLGSNADFTGSWYGVAHPVMSEPGIQGQVIKLMEQVHKLENSKFINVTDFGVSQNGEDITNKLQNILDLAEERGGVSLFFPAGVYIMNGGCTIYSNTTIHFEEGCIIDRSNATTSNFLKGYDVARDRHNIHINGGTFIGNPTLKTGTSLTLHRLNNASFKNMKFWYGNASGHVFDLIGCHHIFIDGCVFEGAEQVEGREYTEAIQLDASNLGSIGTPQPLEIFNGKATSHVTVQNCCFIPIYNELGGIDKYAPNPIGCHSFMKTPYKEIRFINNHVENCPPRKENSTTTEAWIRFYAVEGLWVQGNNFINTMGINNCPVSVQTKTECTEIDGSKISYPVASKNIHIDNNNFEGWTYRTNNKRFSLILIYGLKDNELKNITVNGNTIDKCLPVGMPVEEVGGSHTVYFKDVIGGTVNGNTFNRIRQAFYVEDNVKSVVFSNNTVNECSHTPINISNGERIIIVGNEFYMCNQSFFNIDSKHIIYKDNTFIAFAKPTVNNIYVLRFSNCENVVVQGNYSSELHEDYTALVRGESGSTGCRIVGNTVDKLEIMNNTSTTIDFVELNNYKLGIN